MKNKLDNEELFHFCEQFSIVLRAGISPLEGLELLGSDSRDERSKSIFASLEKNLEETGSFSQALEESGIFPEDMTAYIKAGEETGCLDEVLESLAHRYEQEAEIAAQIKRTVTYPLVMLGMMTAVIVLLLVKVLPVFQQVFRQMGIEMSGVSESFLNTGKIISRYSVVFLVIAAVLTGLILFLCFSEAGRERMKSVMRRIPGIREIPLSIDYSRFTSGICMGIRSGMTPEESMQMAGSLVSEPVVKERLKKAEKLLGEGELFGGVLTESGLFGDMEGRLISIGTYAGAAEEIMEKLSQRYLEDSYARISRVISVVEPAIVILFSILVGLVLVSVMMPLLGVLSQIMA